MPSSPPRSTKSYAPPRRTSEGDAVKSPSGGGALQLDLQPDAHQPGGPMEIPLSSEGVEEEIRRQLQARAGGVPGYPDPRQAVDDDLGAGHYQSAYPQAARVSPASSSLGPSRNSRNSSLSSGIHSSSQSRHSQPPSAYDPRMQYRQPPTGSSRNQYAQYSSQFSSPFQSPTPMSPEQYSTHSFYPTDSPSSPTYGHYAFSPQMHQGSSAQGRPQLSEEDMYTASSDLSRGQSAVVYGSDGSPAPTYAQLSPNFQQPTYVVYQPAGYPQHAYFQSPTQTYSVPLSPSFGGSPILGGLPSNYSAIGTANGSHQPQYFVGQPYATQPYHLYQPQQSHMPSQAGLSPSISRAPLHPHSPSSNNSPLPRSLPVPYAPPPGEGLARGHLAQARFHDAVYNRRDGSRAAGGGGGGGGDTAGWKKARSSALPKPPAHSPHALWVGNVPSDATHGELWHFFSTRPVPAANGHLIKSLDSIPADVDINSTGMESIHLIARSNCAFVNYQSDLHLQHAIIVSHGLSLRPSDPRCKDLVCRVRKQEDNSKSGVGAQRTGGLHHAYINEREKSRAQARKEEAAAADPSSRTTDHRASISSTTRSVSTASTSSSYLGKHFPKRFFVLKSHNEEDLHLSVERGLWATQSHNEPVLDQAFRSCSEGVFLFFSANKSGEWFGYAKMMSPISASQDRRVSWNNRGEESSGSHQSRKSHAGRPETIHEDTATEQSPPMLLSPSEHRLADTSPGPLVPAGSRPRVDSAPAKLTSSRAAQLSSVGQSVVENLHLPTDRRGESLDPKLLDGMSQLELADLEAVQQTVGASDVAAELGDDGVWRKDTLPTAEERNARLEKLEEDGALPLKESSQGWGKPFKLEWIAVTKLPFHRTRSIINAFNGNREIKISRDGTEVEPAAGEELMAEFAREAAKEAERTPTT